VNILLHEPQIPGNTGSVARVCAGTQTPLHLSGTLGFSLDDKYLKRAGLDYWPRVPLQVHSNLDEALSAIGETRVWIFSARATRPFWEADFQPGDTLLFGGETQGLPAEVLERFPLEQHLQIPITDDIRSHNLANAVSIAIYEGLRQRAGNLDLAPRE
jgi:tRNA (cytidine/uridine-2'-O-)-methyltransferase